MVIEERNKENQSLQAKTQQLETELDSEIRRVAEEREDLRRRLQ
jgi:hypothetical protein